MTSFKSESGQLLLIAVLIVAILIIAIPAIVFINQTSTGFGLALFKRNKSRAVTEQGLAYAIHVLSTSTTTWNAALTGAPFNDPSTGLPFVDNTGVPHVYAGSSAGAFTIRVSSGGPLSTPSMQIYEVQIVIKGGTLVPGTTGQVTYNRSVRALVSQKTLAAVLPSEVQTSAALAISTVPVNANALTVHWGPIISFDSTPWFLHGENNSQFYPRKFSNGSITDGDNLGSAYLRSGSSPPQNTDGKEYWADSSLGFPSTIDLNSYIDRAQNNTNVITQLPLTQSSGSPINPGGCSVATPNCGYFQISNDTATFSGPYALTSPNAVIYVEGNAEFDDIAIDLKSAGAIIVTGNLTLGDPGSAGTVLNLRVPPTAPLEYPYSPTNPPSWPCSNNVGQTCTSAAAAATGTPPYGSNKVQFRGFLYVGGNLLFNNPANPWTIDGAVSVGAASGSGLGGSINANGTANKLTIFYDDEINHNILVTPLELMIDYQKDIPAS